MTLEDFFAVKHKGRIVAGANLIPLEWCLSGIPLKVAELGCVATLPEYRRRGLQRRLMEEYHKHVLKKGYDLSAIEGIPFYYRQFGYEYALPLDEETRLAISKIPDYKIDHVIRPLRNKNMPDAMRLLATSQQKYYVHTVRSKDIWKMFQRTRMVAEYEFEGYVVEEKEKPIAYFRTSVNSENRELFLREITDVDQYTAQSILKFLKDMSKHRELETLAATISYHEPFTEHMIAVGGESAPPYAWQVRVTDYMSLFQKLKPLLEKRLAMSTYRHLTEKLNFNFYRYIVQVTLENGTIKNIECLKNCEDRTIRFNPFVFTQLLLGYRSREELQKNYPDFIVRPSHRHLIDVLFPKLQSYIHTAY
jgi:predicted acetyltransferase